MYGEWVYSLLLIVDLSIVLANGADRTCPIRNCNTCLEPSLQVAPGIGFHLGLTSGTAAVSYNDGRVENIVHISGSPEYNALMQDFTDHPDRLDPPQLDTIAHRIDFARKELKRRVNLLSGRPGTPNAATLSSMLVALRSETESRLSTSITTVGIAFANAAFESRNEVNDALVYSGLNKLDNRQMPDRELNSAYGAHGFGLCPSYTDPYQCEQEEDLFRPGEAVLHLDYTSKTLAANTELISTARSTYATRNFVNWKLGRDGASRWEKERDYWKAIEMHIRHLAITARRPFSQLLLTGDCADDDKYLAVVRDALRGSVLADQVEVGTTQMNFKYAVARGAAEFQRRRQQGWLDCVQPKHCTESSFWGKARAKAEQMLEL